jgi:hypothetical protein
VLHKEIVKDTDGNNDLKGEWMARVDWIADHPQYLDIHESYLNPNFVEFIRDQQA